MDYYSPWSQPQNTGRPAPIPDSMLGGGGGSVQLGQGDDSDAGKPWYKSKNILASVVYFFISLLQIVKDLPGIGQSAIWMGVLGMVFAVLVILLRMVTTKPITTTWQTPNPRDWFNKKK